MCVCVCREEKVCATPFQDIFENQVKCRDRQCLELKRPVLSISTSTLNLSPYVHCCATLKLHCARTTDTMQAGVSSNLNIDSFSLQKELLSDFNKTCRLLRNTTITNSNHKLVHFNLKMIFYDAQRLANQLAVICSKHIFPLLKKGWTGGSKCEMFTHKISPKLTASFFFLTISKQV